MRQSAHLELVIDDLNKKVKKQEQQLNDPDLPFNKEFIRGDLENDQFLLNKAEQVKNGQGLSSEDISKIDEFLKDIDYGEVAMDIKQYSEIIK